MGKSTILTFLVAIVFATGCIDDPIPNFSPDIELADVGQEVHFSNSSFKAARYEWDFGDSTFSTVVSPTKIYEEPGFYVITLKVFNKAEESGTMAKTVTVGDRYMQVITVNSMPSTDTAGNPWDPSDAPDIQFALRPAGSTPWSLETAITTDVTSVPFMMSVSAADMMFTMADWEWELRDNDVATYQTIAGGTFHPYTGGSAQHIILEGTGYEVDLNYVAKE